MAADRVGQIFELEICYTHFGTQAPPIENLKQNDSLFKRADMI
jgi:hypothetical protein